MPSYDKQPQNNYYLQRLSTRLKEQTSITGIITDN